MLMVCVLAVYMVICPFDGTKKVYTTQIDNNGNDGYALNLLRSTESGGSYSCDVYRISASDPNTSDSGVRTHGSIAEFTIQLPAYNVWI